jgi:hypothetical protein
MPSCPACGHYLTPTSMKPDGSCPFCSQTVDYVRARKAERLRAAGEEPGAVGAAPWHLKLLVAGTAVYLGYRFLQGVEWIAHKL